MTRYWFVLTKHGDYEPLEVFTGLPPDAPITGQDREMDSTAHEAAYVVLNEFLAWYLEGEDVDTMDFERWTVFALDHEPDIDDIDDIHDNCADLAEWRTPGAGDGMTS